MEEDDFEMGEDDIDHMEEDDLDHFSYSQENYDTLRIQRDTEEEMTLQAVLRGMDPDYDPEYPTLSDDPDEKTEQDYIEYMSYHHPEVRLFDTTEDTSDTWGTICELPPQGYWDRFYWMIRRKWYKYLSGVERPY